MVECTLAKSILIIGAGEEQIPAYKRAKERGLTVIGSDIKLDAPGLEFADYKIIASTRDPKKTREAACAFADNVHPINGVMTIANDVPLTVATVAHALKLPSISLEAARCAQDKLLMKRAFIKHDVFCPWFTEITCLEELEFHTRERDQHLFVLKPVDGRGARGVLLIDGDIDLAWALSEARQWGESGKLILERFIHGTQLSTESYILNEKIYTPAIAERNYARMQEFKPNIIEDGGTIPALLTSTQKNDIDDLLLKAAKAMGIGEGIIKGDLVIDDSGKPAVIELAARLSGGWFASHQIPAASGVDLVDAVISYALGDRVDSAQLTPSISKATAIRYWFPPPGRINDIAGLENIDNDPHILKYGFFRKSGDIQPQIKMHPDRFGFVITVADNRDEAIRIAEKKMNEVIITIA